ncbi:Putative Zinc finger C2H2-type [Colletotrichum destructivum]|uniref:Zinc finger C2H2-type n=1 Tax=Colletotrichum destructivum TaxID=34406 RepID=A0AAX4IFU3_9PEZI|nr:Putative Zinc finger C2H2-type [Colletotrichum destructivum]
MAKSFADLAADINTSFDCLVGTVEDADGFAVQSSLQYKFRDQLARFRVWSGDTGALDKDQDSLESRLRDASHIRTQILELLDDLDQSLKDARHIISSFDPSWIGLKDGEEDLSDVDAETEVTEIAADITDLIDCLSRLSFSIHNPAPHDHIVAPVMANAANIEQQDIQHVRNEFPGIKDYLARRLGNSISRRREFLQYLKTARPSCRSRISTKETEFVQNANTILIREKAKRMISAGDLSDGLSDDSGCVSGGSQSAYQTPEMTPGRNNDPTVTREHSNFGIPLTKEGADITVDCPYCHMEVSVKTASSLKKHLLEDIKPFNCLAKVCTISENSFSTLDEWMQHMVQNHLRTYRCPMLCEKTFTSRSDSAKHLTQDHPNSVSERHVDALIRLSSEPLDPDTSVSCPLCLKSLPSLRKYKKHVGNHLVKLALFALPETGSPKQHHGQDNVGIEEVTLDAGAFVKRPVSPGDGPSPHVSANDDGTKPSNDSKGLDTLIGDTEQPPRGHSQQPSAGEKPTGMEPTTQRPTSPPGGDQQPPNNELSQTTSVSKARPKKYFVSRDGIDHDVIKADICLYLGPDATVQPSVHQAMLDDLKTDSAHWKVERVWIKPAGYGESLTHASRRRYLQTNPTIYAGNGTRSQNSASMYRSRMTSDPEPVNRYGKDLGYDKTAAEIYNKRPGGGYPSAFYPNPTPALLPILYKNKPMLSGIQGWDDFDPQADIPIAEMYKPIGYFNQADG